MATDDYAADARIAAKIQAGNYDAEVEAWLRRFVRKAMTYVLHWGHSHQDAEDYLQDFLLWLHQNRLRTFTSGQSLTGFCFVVFRNGFYRTGQARARDRSRFDLVGLLGEDGLVVQPVAPHPSPEAQIEQGAWRESLEKALHSLRPSDAALIVAYHLEETTVDEIARGLGISVGATKVRIHRAIRRLKRELLRVKGSGYV